MFPVDTLATPHLLVATYAFPATRATRIYRLEREKRLGLLGKSLRLPIAVFRV